MATIISRRHKVKFYLSLILGALLLSGLGTLIIVVFFKANADQNLKVGDYLMLLLGAGLIIMAFHLVISCFKNVPRITIDGNLISFNSEIYPLSEITKVILTGKCKFPYLIGIPMEAATLQFKIGEKRYIYDDMYKNSWELKHYLKQVVVDKKDFKPAAGIAVNMDELVGESFDTFKNSQFISVRGIGFWAFVGVCIYPIISGSKHLGPTAILFLTLLCLMWIIFNAWLMHYFQVSQNFFIVRNHIYLWRRTAFRLTDMKEVVFETREKLPNCLRVITKDFRNKLYPAGTLHDQTWLKLKARLEQQGIKVRNESIR